MGFYHIDNDIVLECYGNDCEIEEKFHYDNFIDAIRSLEANVSLILSKKESCNLKVKKYTNKINHNSGMTEHYEDYRFLREKKLTLLLGEGCPLAAFVVNDGRGKLQIQEVRDNGVIYVYDYETHSKITLFAPHPDRISVLYEAVGELAPDYLIKRSSENFELGYNELFNSEY